MDAETIPHTSEVSTAPPVEAAPTAHPLPRWRQVAVWVAERELWVVLALLPFLFFPNRFTLLGVVSLPPLVWLCRKVAWGYLTLHTPMDIPIMALLLMVPVSLYASVDWILSQVVLYQIIAGVLLFYGLVNGLHSQRAVNWAVGGLISAGTALAVIAPVSVQWPGAKLFALPQIYNRFPLLMPDPINRNVLGGALVMIIPVVASLLLYGRFSTLNRKQILILKAGLGLSLIWMFLMLLLTQSRGALTALAIVILILAGIRWRWLLILGIGYGIALFIGIRHFSLASIADLISSTDTIQGWAGRLEVWSRALYMLQDFPYTGIGLGTFRRVVPVLYPLFLIGPDVEIEHAHNLFLQVGVDLGLPGLVAFVALLTSGFMLTWQTFRCARNRGQFDQQAVALGLFASLVAMVVNDLTHAATWGTKPAVIPWAVLGLSVRLYQIQRELSQCLDST